MCPSRFAFASLSLPEGSNAIPCEQLDFSWQAPAPTQAFYRKLSKLGSLTVASSVAAAREGTSAAAESSKLHHDTLTQPSQLQAQDDNPTPQPPRFPPWKDLNLRTTRTPSNRHVLAEQGEVPDTNCLAVESCAGRRRRIYLPRSDLPVNALSASSPSSSSSAHEPEAFDIVDERQTGEDHFRALVHAYLLPNGFPDSVGPQYAPYMAWRGVQYFFGGAISVFTTQSLLGALGVAGRYSGEAAAAINWVIKDGAGRLGRLLFARWGRELDCELKQFRLAGDLLMEAGAALELATIFAPRAFLPLACTANLSKNLAAVAASSTRAPIYRTFALQNNLADITAKGESVANLADILGTLAGIALSRMALPRMPTFCVLSAGYLLASRKEVDSVELPYMNRARLAYATRRYLADGRVPGVGEANHNEPLLPWGRYNQGRLVLGASVEAACAGPGDLRFAAGQFREGEYRYMVTYRPDTKKAYILLREGAGPLDCLQASFFGHVFLHLMDGGRLDATPMPAHSGLGAGNGNSSSSSNGGNRACFSSSSSSSVSSNGAPEGRCGARGSGECVRGAVCDEGGAGARGGPGQSRGSGRALVGAGADSGPGEGGGIDVKLLRGDAGGEGVAVEGWRAVLCEAQEAVGQLYPDFLAQAEGAGWKLQQTMLNPKENRLLKLSMPLTV